MSDIPLDTEFDILDEEGKLYAADSLNNLNKLNVCSDPQQLLSDLPSSSQDNAIQIAKGGLNGTKESPREGRMESVFRFVKGDEHPPAEEADASKPWCNCSRCLCILLIILTVALAASLIMSFYAIYLMVQTTEKMEGLPNNELNKKVLEEMKEWKVFIVKYLNYSMAAQHGEGGTSEAPPLNSSTDKT
ncbi:leucine-rich single-pass membrane protein 1 isoform X2 [Amia ocellicauda]|uniref:leucine-rich single-pass membrane protein 1 isoform X2 n=1 Tax=Amia ocellicauda TaxID=2972642 RepID=UPI003463CDA6